MAFSFWEYLFSFQRNFTFLYYANEKSDDDIGGSSFTVQQSIKNISRNIGAVFFKQNRTSQQKQNDTYYVVAVATLLAPVPFYEKPNNPICKLFKWSIKILRASRLKKCVVSDAFVKNIYCFLLFVLSDIHAKTRTPRII